METKKIYFAPDVQIINRCQSDILTLSRDNDVAWNSAWNQVFT